MALHHIWRLNHRHKWLCEGLDDDIDDDGLIKIFNPEELNAMRLSMDGSSFKKSSNPFTQCPLNQWVTLHPFPIELG